MHLLFGMVLGFMIGIVAMYAYFYKIHDVVLRIEKHYEDLISTISQWQNKL